MNLLRILLVALLVVTLPVRGVMAAARVCAAGSDAAAAHQIHGAAAADLAVAADDLPTDSQDATEDVADVASEIGADMAHPPDDMAHSAGVSPSPCPHASGDGHPSKGQDSCKLCSACCSVPPLPSGQGAAPQRLDLAFAASPAHAWAAPEHPTGRQERPPRSI